MRLRFVMFLVIGPLFALAGYFVYLELSYLRGSIAKADIVVVGSQESSVINDLVHELQKERGFSAGFIASKGKNFVQELPEQRQASDAAHESYTAKVVHIPEVHPDWAASVIQKLEEVALMRERVDALQATVPEMAKTYTATINQLLAMARPSTEDAKVDRLQGLLQARMLTSAVKEKAGLERATGAAGLGAGFSLAAFDRYVALVGGQNSLLPEIASFAGANSWLAGLQATPEFIAISEARKVIVDGFKTGDYQGLTAANWFQISTAWIDLMRERELELAAEASVIAAEIKAGANSEYQFILYSSLACMVFAIAVAIYIFEKLIKRVKGLTSNVKDFTAGNFKVRIEGIEGKDEVSLMARAVYHFKQDTLEMQRNALALEEDQKARKKEQDYVVDELKRGLSSLSAGDLCVAIETPFPGDYESLREDFNHTVVKLASTMHEVVDASGSIGRGADEIKQASDDLSHRTESQAATLEETSAALEELTSSVKDAASRAGSAATTSAEASDEASQSGEVVKQAVSAMSEIEESSNQIAQIIGVIDDIAFQTNLLALNAGVEAARAGEAGRGFAVVASEVRGLAQRSSDAAMEIKSLISKSSGQVEHGVTLVRKAGEALDKIVGRVTDISNLISKIAEGANEQSEGISELNIGVSQLDQVTQQNAAMVEEATAASHLLQTDATRLVSVVSSFTLPNTSATAHGAAMFEQAGDGFSEPIASVG